MVFQQAKKSDAKRKMEEKGFNRRERKRERGTQIL